MEIQIRRSCNGRTETKKRVSREAARVEYRKLAKRVAEENEKAGEKRWIIDCLNTETGEVIWHN